MFSLWAWPILLREKTNSLSFNSCSFLLRSLSHLLHTIHVSIKIVEYKKEAWIYIQISSVPYWRVLIGRKHGLAVPVLTDFSVSVASLMISNVLQQKNFSMIPTFTAHMRTCWNMAWPLSNSTEKWVTTFSAHTNFSHRTPDFVWLKLDYRCVIMSCSAIFPKLSIAVLCCYTSSLKTCKINNVNPCENILICSWGKGMFYTQ